MKAKHPIQEFNGVRFYFKPGGYYKSNRPGVLMHRAVWEHHHGPIPPGHHVHHRNHDRADNRIENLELLVAAKHFLRHSDERTEAEREQCRRTLRDHARPAAAKWHGSKAGRAVHRRIGKESWKNQTPVEKVCVQCGNKFMGYPNRAKVGYCSMNCQQRARRASGVDNVTRKCLWCHEPFQTDKNKKQKACSLSCGARISAEKRLGRWT